MSTGKTNGDQKPTISASNHDQNVGQRGGKLSSDHAEEPNTGMRVAEGGNKVQGDDLEDLIPGKSPNKRGAETFDPDGEPLDRNKTARGHDEDPEGGGSADNSEDEDRGAETFDIEGELVGSTDIGDRDEGNRRGDGEPDAKPASKKR